MNQNAEKVYQKKEWKPKCQQPPKSAWKPRNLDLIREHEEVKDRNVIVGHNQAEQVHGPGPPISLRLISC